MDCLFPFRHPVNGLLPCGKCVPCLKKKQDDWTFRLTEEFNNSFSAVFVTLTYRDEFVPTAIIYGQQYNVVSKRDIQLFIKRLRKRLDYPIRYFVASEYGPKTLRPHYHAILFNFNVRRHYGLISKCWKKGFVSVSSVTPGRIGYVAKYCNCYTDLPDALRRPNYRPFLLCSRRPAIGSSFLTPAKTDYYRQTCSTVVHYRDGRKYSLPKYFRDKLFDDEMKLTIRQRIDEYRTQRDAEFVQRYVTSPDYAGVDMFQQQRDNVSRIQNKFTKSKL